MSSNPIPNSFTPVTPKNAQGNRSDIAWKHCLSVDGDTRKLECKYCQKVVIGRAYRLKHHLAGTQKNVGACKDVPEEVKKEMREIVVGLQQKLNKKSSLNMDEEMAETAGDKRKHSEASSDNMFKRVFSKQPTINNMFKKGLTEEACQAIARFFYNNAIPFNVAKSEEFMTMFELVSRHGLGFKPPSYHEIRVKYLKEEVANTSLALQAHRDEWKKMGCTIMIDGWMDKKRRTIINFLVNSPKGTVFLKFIDASAISKTSEKVFEMIDNVVEEVGEDNVIQVVTDNAANYKAAGQMLMAKRKKLFWTPCAAHCVDLMLEDYEKKIPIHEETISKGKKITTFIYSRTSLICLLQHFTKGRDLVRSGITHFATSYLTLGRLHENKGALIRMFTSEEWKTSKFAKTNDGNMLKMWC